MIKQYTQYILIVLSTNLVWSRKVHQFSLMTVKQFTLLQHTPYVARSLSMESINKVFVSLTDLTNIISGEDYATVPIVKSYLHYISTKILAAEMMIMHGLTVQLNSNLTLIFDHSHVFTDFIQVPDQWLHVFCEQSVTHVV